MNTSVEYSTRMTRGIIRHASTLSAITNDMCRKSITIFIKVGNKMGRKKRSLPFVEARKIVHEERIESVAQYKKWHDLNKPAGLPKRPDRAYISEFTSWNDFLGNDNPFPIVKHKWRSYGEAKAFAQSLNISTRAQWFEMCDNGGKPQDIPRRPDLYYRDKNEWISWGNFLGVTLLSRVQTVADTDTIFYIIYNPRADKNYFKCGLTNGGLSSVNDFLRKINGRAVCTYFVPQTFKHEKFMTDAGAEIDHEHKGYFYIPNMHTIISKLSISYQKASG